MVVKGGSAGDEGAEMTWRHIQWKSRLGLGSSGRVQMAVLPPAHILVMIADSAKRLEDSLLHWCQIIRLQLRLNDLRQLVLRVASQQGECSTRHPS